MESLKEGLDLRHDSRGHFKFRGKLDVFCFVLFCYSDGTSSWLQFNALGLAKGVMIN